MGSKTGTQGDKSSKTWQKVHNRWTKSPSEVLQVPRVLDRGIVVTEDVWRTERKNLLIDWLDERAGRSLVRYGNIRGGKVMERKQIRSIQPTLDHRRREEEGRDLPHWTVTKASSEAVLFEMHAFVPQHYLLPQKHLCEMKWATLK